LVLLWQDRDIVLEWVWHPKLLAAHIRNTLVSIPVFGLGQCLVDAVVEVLVVGEDNMATNIVELRGKGLDSFSSQLKGGRLTKPSGVTSVEARPPGVSFESIIIHDGPS